MKAVEKSDKSRNKYAMCTLDICDTFEFFYRKEPDASGRRGKCIRWGVVCDYDEGEPQPAPPPPPSSPGSKPTS